MADGPLSHTAYRAVEKILLAADERIHELTPFQRDFVDHNLTRLARFEERTRFSRPQIQIVVEIADFLDLDASDLEEDDHA